MLLFVLLIGQLIGADGKAYLFTCPAYPRLESGVAIHGVPVIEDALRQLVVRRGGTSLSTGDLYEPGELLLITLNDTSGDADIIFETNCSTCTFKFGICPGKYRFIGRVASVNMPTDFSNFTVWGAYAVSDGVVRIAPPIHLRPRVPDPTMAPTFANPPTISPTQISAARHSILIDVRYDGMSKSAVINNSDAISDAICSHMDYRGERCKLIAALNDQSGDTVVPASLWSTVSDILDGAIRKRFRFIRPTRELTPNAKSIGTIIVDGFMYPEWQQPAIRSISEYINTAGSGGYTEALRALVGMGDLIGTTVLRARIVNNTDSALFAHSCSIDESLALFWALDTARPARFVRGLLQIGGTHWVAGGVVGDDVRAMVTDPNNVVFLFNAETDRVSILLV